MSNAERIASIKAQIEELKAERNRICKKLKKLRQRLNQAEREARNEHE